VFHHPCVIPIYIDWCPAVNDSSAVNGGGSCEGVAMLLVIVNASDLFQGHLIKKSLDELVFYIMQHLLTIIPPTQFSTCLPSSCPPHSLGGYLFHLLNAIESGLFEEGGGGTGHNEKHLTQFKNQTVIF